MSGDSDPLWGRDDTGFEVVARNVASRYAMVGADALIGALLLPFNIYHLGQSAWGLWILSASFNTYFAAIDLGYAGSLTRFVAHYRARRDRDAINEVLSTVGLVLCGMSVLALAGFGVAAVFVGSIFNLDPQQVPTARALVLLNGLVVATGLPFSVFGGVVNGFQRYHLNSGVAVASSVTVAIVNVVVLLGGGALLTLVAATTAVRLAFFGLYRWNAYRVFPGLSLGFARFRRARLREVSAFGAPLSIIVWSHRLTYASAQIIIGAVLSPAAVAIWGVPQRLALLVRSLTNQLGAVLMPVVVDSDTRLRDGYLAMLLLQGTRISLMMVMPLATCMVMLGDLLIPAWVGSGFEASVPLLQVLAIVIVLRVARTIPTTVLKGAGRHTALAGIDAAVAVATVGLSLLWIRQFGLIGVAYGVLVPLGLGTIFLVWPLACRRVGLTVLAATRQGVWPAVWPVVIMSVVVAGLRWSLSGGVLELIVAATGGCLVYVTTVWLIALSPRERAGYRALARRILRPGRSPVVETSAAVVFPDV